MTRLIRTVGVLLVLLAGAAVLVGCSSTLAPAEDAAAASPASLVSSSEGTRAPGATSAASGPTVEALRAAAHGGKYLFVFFWKTEDERTLAMRRVFDNAVERAGERADRAAANVADPAERELVEQLGVDRAPLPLVLAFAPNGAITGGFPAEFTEEQLLGAFATPAEVQCIKALQDNKLVLLCVQNSRTKLNQEAMRGVSDFKSDERFAGATAVVMLDPAQRSETDFLGKLEVPADTETAVTVLLAPPGMAIGMFEGATTKSVFEQTLRQAAGSRCCPGGACGPGGRAPP